MLHHAFLRRIVSCLRDRRGASAIEHALLCVMVALAILAALKTLAAGTVGQLESVRGTVAEAVGS